MDSSMASIGQSPSSPAPELIDSTAAETNHACITGIVNENEGETTSGQPQSYSGEELSAENNCTVNSSRDEIQQLSDKLKIAGQRISKLKNELAKEKKELSMATYIIKGQMKVVDSAEQKQKELEICLNQEKTRRIAAEEKIKKLRESTDHVSCKISELINQLQALFPNWLENSEIIGQENATESFQKLLLDKLAIFVAQKFDQFKKERASTKAELENIKTVVEKLMMMITCNDRVKSVAAKPSSESRAKTQLENSTIATITSNTFVEASVSPPPTPPVVVVDRKEKRKATIHAEDWTKSRKGAYYCVCGKYNRFKNNLINHIRLETEQGKFKCTVCKRRFVFRSGLLAHKKCKNKILRGSDNSTDCVGENSNKCINEKMNVSEKDLPPPSLPVQNLTSNGLEIVRKTNKDRHGLNRKRMQDGYFCLCEKKFISMKRLNMHMRHHRKLSKSTGSKKVQRRNKKQNHSPVQPEQETNHFVDTESGKGKFVCGCGAQFSSRYSLSLHVKRLVSGKKFGCDYCLKRYYVASELKLHLKRHHNVDLKNTIGCMDCGLLFETRSTLYAHQRNAHPVSNSTDKRRKKRVNEDPSPIPVPIPIKISDGHEPTTSTSVITAASPNKVASSAVVVEQNNSTKCNKLVHELIFSGHNLNF